MRTNIIKIYTVKYWQIAENSLEALPLQKPVLEAPQSQRSWQWGVGPLFEVACPCRTHDFAVARFGFAPNEKGLKEMIRALQAGDSRWYFLVNTCQTFLEIQSQHQPQNCSSKIKTIQLPKFNTSQQHVSRKNDVKDHLHGPGMDETVKRQRRATVQDTQSSQYARCDMMRWAEDAIQHEIIHKSVQAPLRFMSRSFSLSTKSECQNCRAADETTMALYGAALSKAAKKPSTKNESLWLVLRANDER